MILMVMAMSETSSGAPSTGAYTINTHNIRGFMNAQSDRLIVHRNGV